MKSLLLPLLFCFNQLQAQPVLVKDIFPGPKDCIPQNLTDYNGKLIFTADDSLHGYELWEADGTNVSIVEDLYPGIGSSGSVGSTYQKSVLNGIMYFSARDTNNRNQIELFKWDGVTKVQKVIDYMGDPIGGHPSFLCALNNKLYYIKSYSFGWELSVYDPSTGIEKFVKDIDPNYFQKGFCNELTALNNGLYFSSYYTDNNGSNSMQVFKYDPTTKTLTISGELNSDTYPFGFKYLNGKVYFLNPKGGAVSELWCWDGVHHATRVNKILYANQYIEVYKDKIYGVATHYHHGPSSIFTYDPTTNTTNRLNITEPLLNTQLTSYASKLFFSAGYKLFSLDGTDVTPLTFGSSTKFTSRFMAVGGSTLYFTGEDSTHGEELYAYYEAPTSANTLTQEKLVSIYPNPTTSAWNFEVAGIKAKNLQLIITDAFGRVVSKQVIEDNTVAASVPTLGNYVYYITDANGTALQTGKLQRL